MLPLEENFDLCALQLLVDIGEIVFYGLVLQANVMVFGRWTTYSLVPDGDAVTLTGLGRKFTYDSGEDGVSVPVHQGGQIQIKVEREGKCIFLEVAIVQELVNLL